MTQPCKPYKRPLFGSKGINKFRKYMEFSKVVILKDIRRIKKTLTILVLGKILLNGIGTWIRDMVKILPPSIFTMSLILPPYWSKKIYFLNFELNRYLSSLTLVMMGGK